MSSLFGGSSSSKDAEVTTGKTVRMPTETDASVKDAGSKTRAAAISRIGRDSTILTDSTKDKIGGRITKTDKLGG
jgi:hypothetical protein